MIESPHLASAIKYAHKAMLEAAKHYEAVLEHVLLTCEHKLLGEAPSIEEWGAHARPSRVCLTCGLREDLVDDRYQVLISTQVQELKPFELHGYTRRRLHQADIASWLAKRSAYHD